MKEWTKERKFTKPQLKRRNKALEEDSSALKRWHPFPEKAVNTVNQRCAERDPIAYVLPPKIQFHPLRGKPRKPIWNKTEVRKGVETENIWEDVEPMENDVDFPDKELGQEVKEKGCYVHVYPQPGLWIPTEEYTRAFGALVVATHGCLESQAGDPASCYVALIAIT